MPSGAPGTPAPFPVARYTIDEDSGLVAPDVSGNGWEGSLVDNPVRVPRVHATKPAPA